VKQDQNTCIEGVLFIVYNYVSKKLMNSYIYQYDIININIFQFFVNGIKYEGNVGGHRGQSIWENFTRSYPGISLSLSLIMNFSNLIIIICFIGFCLPLRYVAKNNSFNFFNWIFHISSNFLERITRLEFRIQD